MLAMLALVLVASMIVIGVFVVYIKASGQSAVESFVPSIAYDAASSLDKTIDGYGLTVAKVAAKLDTNAKPAAPKPLSCGRFSRVIPPIAQTGICTAAQISRKTA